MSDDLRARAAKATQSAICEHEIQGRITDDTAQELGMLLDEAISTLTRLQEWKTIVMNGGDIARDRFVAGQYLTPVVESWKAKVAELEATISRLRRQLADADRLAEQRLAERNSVQEELDALNAESAERDATIEALSDENDALCEGLALAGLVSKKKDGEIDDLRRQLSALGKEAEADAEHAAVASSVDLRHLLQDLIGERDREKRDAERLGAEIAAIKAQLAEAQDEAKGLRLCWDTEKRLNRSLDHQSAVLDDVRRQLAEAQAGWMAVIADNDRMRTERAEIDARDERSIKALLMAMQEYGFDEATHSKEAWESFLVAVRMYMEPADRQEFDAIRNRKEPANE